MPQTKPKILVTGSAGFVAGYLVEELLRSGYEVVGIDNYSKYGPIERSYDNHPNYHFTEGDAKDQSLIRELIKDCDQAVALAAMVGGVSYFQRFPYDLLVENIRLTDAIFTAAIWAFQNGNFKKINVISSSMVYEHASNYPTIEGEQLLCPPSSTTYGFQKLSCEYYAKAALQQYGLPYTIIRPFNCIGAGEIKAQKALEEKPGNVKLVMSHVVPDLIVKILQGQDPLHIFGSGDQVRNYIYGADLALGIRLCLERPQAINEDFNLGSHNSLTVLELARTIWQKLNPDKPFRYVSDEVWYSDVLKNMPDNRKAQELLGFEAKVSLSEALDQIIPWVKEQMEKGVI